MILALDIGNTNITMGVFDGRDLKFVSRLATDRQRTEDQYAVELRDIVDIYGVSIGEIEGSIISSVVPSLTSGIKRAVKRLTRTEPLCIGPGMKTGLNIKLNDPSTLGADLVAGAVAAIELFDCPCIIFDIGTATTISVLDADASMLGGVIIPGPGIALEALTARSQREHAFLRQRMLRRCNELSVTLYQYAQRPAFLRQPGGAEACDRLQYRRLHAFRLRIRHRLYDGWNVRPDRGGAG